MPLSANVPQMASNSGDLHPTKPKQLTSVLLEWLFHYIEPLFSF